MTTKIYTSLPGIRTRRRSLGLQAAPLAETLGVTRSAWSQWEAGTTMPSAGYLPALAELLQCTIEELYRDSGERSFADAQDDGRERSFAGAQDDGRERSFAGAQDDGEGDGGEAAADDDGAD